MGEVIPIAKEILTINVTGELGLAAKGIISLDKAAEIIAERLKLVPGDAELRNIIHNLQSLPKGRDEKQADFYALMEWLKDWGDDGDRLLVIDDIWGP